jgi:protein-S-isoprenylcysteine O-methyltransferase Ste14/membrane-associated phospholipid phosphatase
MLPGMRATSIGKVLYGALFTVALPVALVAWARATSDVVRAPLHAAPAVGVPLAGAGIVLVLAGWWALKVLGGGLPMNAFPPPKLVTRGVYAIFENPIYVGFCAACAGVSMTTGSASGVYLVTPAIALGCTALVMGHEGPRLRERFGPRPSPWLRLARDDEAQPAWQERLAAYGIAIAPWAALYEVIAQAGTPPDAFSLALPGEDAWPVFEGAEVVYASTYAVVLLAPLLAPTRRALRDLEVGALIAMALVFPIYFALPVVAEPRAFEPHGPLGRLLVLERALDTPAEAFPSFHVLWAMLAARALGARRPLRIAAWCWAAAVMASCVATGMHTVADVAAGAAAYGVVVHARGIWDRMRAWAERVANSWREWRFDGVRVINHGAYAGAGTAGALVVVAALVGRGHAAPVAIAAIAGLAVSALWAQVIEGSSQLMRPYGFYGGVLGIVLGALAAPPFGVSVWRLLGAYCVAGPLVQSMGRLRCLVQGCCHGAPCAPALGITYRHPRSRVTRVAGLGGVPVHPTPVYSIAWNVVVATVMVRLWSLHVPTHFVAGVYLLMTGLGRFVEEGFRGEPQTPTYAGLRLYQWIGAGTAIAGATITAVVRSDAATVPSLDGASVVVALVVGAFVGCALGVDFPGSTKRFSRLA